jgi:hypothetical protein
MNGSKRQTIEAQLAALEARVFPLHVPEPIAPEVTAAFLEVVILVHERTGSRKLAIKAAGIRATAVAADLAEDLPARAPLSDGGVLTVEGAAELDRLLIDVGWNLGDPPRSYDKRTYRPIRGEKE